MLKKGFFFFICFCFNLFLLTLNLMGGKILMQFKAFFFFKQAQEIKKLTLFRQ